MCISIMFVWNTIRNSSAQEFTIPDNSYSHHYLFVFLGGPRNEEVNILTYWARKWSIRGFP